MSVDWNVPFNRFFRLFELAREQDPKNMGAATLATVDERGRPTARVVLVKGFDPRGFAFFTNYDSHKARHLLGNQQAALCFYWPAIDIQVRVEGAVQKASAQQSNEYFDSRPREAQLSAWASRQSQPLEAPGLLQKRLQGFRAQYERRPVPRPLNWGGLVLVPDRIEFWSARASRLHEREVYVKDGEGWVTRALFP